MNWFVDLWNGLVAFFTGTATMENFTIGHRIFVAIIVIVAGVYLIKFLIFVLRKAAGIKVKRLDIDVSVKSFSISLINASLNVGLAIFVCAILGFDFNNFASVISAVTVALGLSLQDLIKSLFSGIVLINAKYFKTGDCIEIKHPNGLCVGNVSVVRLLYTKVKTFNGEMMIIANGDILKSVITNFTEKDTRRITFDIKLDFYSDVDKCREAINKAAKSVKEILDDPALSVIVGDLSESCVVLTVRCWTKSAEYASTKFSLIEACLKELQSINVPVLTTRIAQTEAPTL